MIVLTGEKREKIKSQLSARLTAHFMIGVLDMTFRQAKGNRENQKEEAQKFNEELSKRADDDADEIIDVFMKTLNGEKAA